MNRKLALAVGSGSCAGAVLALAVGLVLLPSSTFKGLLLLGVGVVSMEGGVQLIRAARATETAFVLPPLLRGAVALGAAGVGAAAFYLGWAVPADDEQRAWVPWAMTAIAVLCGWIAIRAGWHAISGAGPRDRA